MNSFFVFLTMIFLHIVADYNLQGILASMKQIGWWENAFAKQGMTKEEFHKSMYAKDYKVALLTHSFAWTFLMMLPLALDFKMNFIYVFAFVLNLIIHMYVDDLKANQLKINLVQDQLLHLLQILITWALFYM